MATRLASLGEYMGEIGNPVREEPLVVPAPIHEPLREEPSPVKVPERVPQPA